jgi:hypothetical protein
MLELAVRLYLEEAYGEGPVPDPVRERLTWPPAETAAEVARGEAFERTPPDAPPARCERIRLRLGHRTFPHMKLGINRVPETDDWVLTVDTHDESLLAVVHQEERAVLEGLVRLNAELKARIERRWGEAGLPTFARYIRDQLKHR